MRINFDTLRDISILRVAESLGMKLKKTGYGTYAMREADQLTSLVIFEKTNTWKRFSGKEQGGVSQGSPVDLVLHIRECSLRQAIDFLTSRFI